MIKISEDLILPGDAVTQKFAFLARSGAGKTYAAGKMVEEMIGDGAEVVVVDPVGVWWGLRVAADGARPGIPDVYVFGGQRGDLPLEATAGALMADVVVDQRICAVLDVSEMTGGEQRRFVCDFATRLLQRKKQARSPLMVVWEECQDFVPQRVMADSARMVGAMERLIKQGRNFGIGTTLISQRPQAVNKDVLNQTECLVVLQTTGPQERKTIHGWVVENAADVSSAVDELPKLDKGEAFVWSPQWLRVFKRIKVGKKKTFDASSTPTADTNETERRLAPVDLDALRERMAATIERAKADDPKVLRAEIARLNAQVKRLNDAPSTKVLAASTKIVEVPAVSAEVVQQLDAAVNRLDALRDAVLEAGADVQDAVEVVVAALAKIPASRAKGTEVHRVVEQMRVKEGQKVVQQGQKVAPPGRKTDPRPALATNGDASLPRGAREMLHAIACFRGRVVPIGYMTVMTALKQGGSTMRGYLGMLRTRGLVEDVPGGLLLTPAGMTALGAPPDRMPTTDEILELWRPKLPAGARAILAEVVAAYPGGVDREQLGEKLAMEPRGSTMRGYVGMLRSNGMLERGEPLCATPALFPSDAA